MKIILEDGKYQIDPEMDFDELKALLPMEAEIALVDLGGDCRTYRFLMKEHALVCQPKMSSGKHFQYEFDHEDRRWKKSKTNVRG